MTQPAWLQVKGDPSVRDFLFQQTHQTSLFDERIDDVMYIVNELLVMRGVFHAKIHFSSNQLTTWLYDDPYRYRVHVREQVLAPGFIRSHDRVVPIEKPVIPCDAVWLLLLEFRRLRFADPNVYLRNASINRINGLIGLSFSCDGSHYIPYESFFETVGRL